MNSASESGSQYLPHGDLGIGEYSTAEFYGLDMIDCPSIQVDNNIQYFHESDREAIFNASPENWNDCLISDVGE